jgi:hypothetical protein
MLRTTPIGPLVKEAGLRSADSLLANRQRRYATRAFELPYGNPIGDGIRNCYTRINYIPKYYTQLLTKLQCYKRVTHEVTHCHDRVTHEVT